jgi:hypothetical protein
MSDAGNDRAIEHVKEQQYEIISLLKYDAKDVEMAGPNVASSAIQFGQDEKEWHRAFDIIEAGASVQATLRPKLTGQPSTFRLEISWTDTSDERHSEWCTIPQPGRTRADIRSPIPLGSHQRLAALPRRPRGNRWRTQRCRTALSFGCKISTEQSIPSTARTKSPTNRLESSM